MQNGVWFYAMEVRFAIFFCYSETNPKISWNLLYISFSLPFGACRRYEAKLNRAMDYSQSIRRIFGQNNWARRLLGSHGTTTEPHSSPSALESATTLDFADPDIRGYKVDEIKSSLDDIRLHGEQTKGHRRRPGQSARGSCHCEKRSDQGAGSKETNHMFTDADIKIEKHETGLCFMCHSFFIGESEKRSKRRTRLSLQDTSPADWSPHSTLLHPNLRHLKAASDSGCPLCVLISHSVYANVEKPNPRSSVYLSTNPRGRSRSRPGNISHLVARVQPPGCNQHCPSVHFTEISLQRDGELPLSDDLRKILFNRLTSGDPGTDSPSSFLLAERWLRECVQSHASCQLPVSPLPTRVIDVGPPDGSQEPFLHESLNQKSAYATLSYCWGGSIPLTTTSATLPARKKAIPLSLMPQTFRDAVTITRAMNVRYLWIDALCILQDSFEDWETHSSRMCNIYRHALFTIAAAKAKTAMEGCFATRDGLCNHPYIFQRPESSNRFSTWTATTSTDSLDDAVDTHLSQRAWVFQEQMLSPRILYYGSNGISWHCIESKATEASPTLKSGLDFFSMFQQKYLSRNLNIDSFEIDRLVKTTWQEVVEQYTRRKLTRGSDKLAALQGVAELLERVTNMGFVAGLQEDQLHQDLLWAILARFNPVHPEVHPPIAPSWSWASTNFPVWYKGRNEHFVRTSIIQPPHMDRFASSQHGKLVVRGLVRQAITIDTGLEISNNLICICDMIEGEKLEVISTPRMSWKPDVSLPPNTHIWLVEILRTVTRSEANLKYVYKNVFSLGLIPVREDVDGVQFRRVGMATCKFSMVLGKPSEARGFRYRPNSVAPDDAELERSILIKEKVYWTEHLDTVTII